MRTPSVSPSRNRPAVVAALLAIACLPHGAGAQQPSAIGEDQIHRSLNPPLYRSLRTSVRTGWRPPPAAPVTRSAGAAAGGTARSLAAVQARTNPDGQIALPAIRFKLDSTELLDAAAASQVDQLAGALKRNDSLKNRYLIEGHTCALGADRHNLELSYARAAALVELLRQRGVATAMLEPVGCGEAEAARDNVAESAPEQELARYRKVMVHQLVGAVQPAPGP